MGAEYVEYTIKGGNKLRVEKEFDRLQQLAAWECGNSYSGAINMANGLEFTGKRFKTYGEASDFLSSTAKKWESALVCEYRNNKGQLVWLLGAWCSS